MYPLSLKPLTYQPYTAIWLALSLGAVCLIITPCIKFEYETQCEILITLGINKRWKSFRLDWIWNSLWNSDYFGHNIEMKKLSLSKLIGFLLGSVPSIPKELRQVTQIMIFLFQIIKFLFPIKIFLNVKLLFANVKNIKFLYTNTKLLNVKLLSANVKFW